MIRFAAFLLMLVSPGFVFAEEVLQIPTSSPSAEGPQAEEAQGAQAASSEASIGPNQHYVGFSPGIYNRSSTAKAAINARYEYLMIDGMFGAGAMVTYVASDPAALMLTIPVFFHLRSSNEGPADFSIFFAPGSTRISGQKPDAALLVGIQKEFQLGNVLLAPLVYGDFSKNGTPFFAGLNLGFKTTRK
jgi:hypothetical protein